MSGHALAATAVGKTSFFTLSNVIGSVEDIEIVIDSPLGDSVPTQVQEISKGTFKAEFCPRVAGEHQVRKFLYFNSGRELFMHGKAMVPYVQLSINCGLDNFTTVQNLFSLYQKPILQLVDNCTYGTIAFPCIKSFLLRVKIILSRVNLKKLFWHKLHQN